MPGDVAKLQSAFSRLVDEHDPLEALRAARDARELMAAWESHLARQALAVGATWETIGSALGISRQAAWERLRPGIAAEIEIDRARIETERQRLRSERGKRWPTKKT